MLFKPLLLLFSTLFFPTLALIAPRQAELTSSAQKVVQGSIVVDGNGTTLAYIDSGAPRASNYVTLFAIHGLAFTNSVFERLFAPGYNSSVRVVTINRRNYPGSTPYTAAEVDILNNGSDEQKTTFLNAQGNHLTTFIDKFIQQNHLPAISTDGKQGGIAVLGWSLGNTLSLASISNLDSAPADVQARFTKYLRSIIMLEPPAIALGLPSPPQTWSPTQDTTIPTELQITSFSQWITSYFKHGDLTTRDPNVLSYVIPTPLKVPSIYTMTPAEHDRLVYEPPAAGVDSLYMFALTGQFLNNYRKACFDQNLKSLLPKMKVWMVTGDATASFSIVSLWAIQDDDAQRGGNNVNYKVLPGTNHFVHWDQAAFTLKAIIDMMS